MKARTTTVLFALLMAILLMTGGRPRAASQADGATAKRMRFQVATIEESAGGRKVISNATIEGPPGTDFVVDLQSGRFNMNARFLTDLISPGQLKVRTKLNTKRLYGYSTRDLPLYEEDNQNETLQLGFEEQLVLLPFGKGSGEVLKIEVTPSMTDQPVYLASGEMQPPVINISDPSPGGIIGIHALKTPHDFQVEAVLLEDDREVARGESRCLLEDPQQILLQPNDRAGADVVGNPIVINMTIGGSETGCAVDQVAINFDIDRANNADQSTAQPFARRWSGIARLGSATNYGLSNYYLKSSDKKYELRFMIKLAGSATSHQRSQGL